MAVPMPIRPLHRPIGLLTMMLLVALALREDRAARTDVPVIAFVGALAQGEDPTFDKFGAALARAWARDTRRPDVRYFSAGTSDDKARFNAAILAAAAIRPSVLVLPYWLDGQGGPEPGRRPASCLLSLHRPDG